MLSINYGLLIQSLIDLTKSPSDWSKQKAPSRTLIGANRTSVILVKITTNKTIKVLRYLSMG